MLGVEDSTERNDVVLSYVLGELVTKGGTTVVSSGDEGVAKAVEIGEEKEAAGVEDEWPSSLLGEEPIEVVNIAADGAASVDIVRHV
jgi:hypothetical protein